MSPRRCSKYFVFFLLFVRCCDCHGGLRPDLSLGPGLPSLPVGSAPCSNSAYGDHGLCVRAIECEATKGVRIGECDGGGGGGVCCHRLSCSAVAADRETLELLFGFGLRNVRRASQWNPYPPQLSAGATPQSPSTEGATCGITLQGANGLPRYPWLLALWRRGRRRVSLPRVNRGDEEKAEEGDLPICGAAIISPERAVTAAHCVQKRSSSYFVRAGTDLNAPGAGFEVSVMAVHVHDKFDARTFENDVAILELDAPEMNRILSPGLIFPVCLPEAVKASQEVSEYSGESALVAGWGCLAEDNCATETLPQLLKETSMPVVDNDLAMCWFMNDSERGQGTAEYIPQRVFLVGGDEQGEKTTCRGDSGSPAVRRRPSDGLWEVVGIVSWSRGCGRRFRPSVWTRVESFVDWIRGRIPTERFK